MTHAKRVAIDVRAIWEHVLTCPWCRTHPLMQAAGWDLQAVTCMNSSNQPKSDRRSLDR